MKREKRVLICDKCGAENWNLASEGLSHDQPAKEVKGYSACDGVWRFPSDPGADALAFLKRIVDEEQARYDQAYRAALVHNNTDGVGIHFDYAPYPKLPDWFNEARDILAKAID